MTLVDLGNAANLGGRSRPNMTLDSPEREPNPIANPATRPRRSVRSKLAWHSAAADERVAFLADAEPRGAGRIEIRGADAGMYIAHRLIVEADAALLNQPAALGLGTRHAESDGDVDDEYGLIAGEGK